MRFATTAYYSLLTSFCLVSPVVSKSTLPDLLAQVTTAFADAKVVPDVLSDFTPSAAVNIHFTDPDTGLQLDPAPGQYLTMDQTSGDPTYTLIAVNGTSDPRAFGPLVLVMTDPDAPTPQNRTDGEIIHFLGGNFTLGEGDKGTTLTNGTVAFHRYWMPRPQNGSDPHRYILLVYPQPEDFDAQVERYFADVPVIFYLENRSKFSLRNFVSELKLGEPIAGNFFKVGPNGNVLSTTVSSAAAVTGPSANPTVTPLTAAAQGHRGVAAMEAGSVMQILGLSMAMSLFATVGLA